MKLEYLEKRDENNVLQWFSGYELAHSLTNSSTSLLKDSIVIKYASNFIPKKLILLYFEKLLFYQFLPIAHQIKIFQWLKDNNQSVNKLKINLENFSCPELMENTLNENGYQIGLNKSFKSKLHDQLYFWYFTHKENFKLLSFLKSKKQNKPHLSGRSNIAVNYCEGIDKDKRSDLFFLDYNIIDTSTVYLYFEYPQILSKHVNEKDLLKFVKEYDVKIVKFWEWNPVKKYDFFINFNKEKIKKRLNNSTDKWIFNHLVYLFYNVNKWYGFFKDYKIKLHIDPSEYGQTTIIKQIALKLADGCSIGKIRSYPNNIKGVFSNYFPNDIIFTWGADGAERINKSQNKLDNIILSGFPYSKNSSNNELNLSIKNQFEKQNIKFKILLLDNNHAKNEGIKQDIETNKLEQFYSSFFDWILKDNEVGLIIKSKKKNIIDSLPQMKNSFEKIKNTNRCYVVPSPFQVMPSSIVDQCDFVVSVNIFFPSSLIECIIKGKRGVFYDYPGIFQFEKNKMFNKKNILFFDNLNQMIDSMKSFKKNPVKTNSLGNWSSFVQEFDPFQDDLGGKRIAEYLKSLQEGFNKKFNSKESILLANEFYQRKWGENKLFKKNHDFFFIK